MTDPHPTTEAAPTPPLSTGTAPAATPQEGTRASWKARDRILLAVLLGLGALYFFPRATQAALDAAFTKPPPPAHEATTAVLDNLARTIDHYHHRHRALPLSVRDAVVFQGGAIATHDGWGRPLNYFRVLYRDVDAERGYVICSAGPDGWHDNGDDVCVGRVIEGGQLRPVTDALGSDWYVPATP